MAAQFVTITKEQMHSVLTACGFTHTPNPKSLEYMYDKSVEFNGIPYILRVFTSVDTRTNKSRSIGADAIRTVVLTQAGKVVSKEKRVNRSEGWAIRLNARIDTWNQDLHTCPQCQKGMLVLRKGKFGQFYGCTTYPQCGYITRAL